MQLNQPGTAKPAGTARRTLLVFAVGLLLGALGWLAIQKVAIERDADAGGTETAEAPHDAGAQAIRVEPAALGNVGLTVEKVQVRTMQETIDATGTVGINESAVAHIKPLARGRVEKVYVRLGDRVQAQQPLIDYDNIELGELIGQYLSAVADLEQARTEAEVDKRSLERAQNLVDIGGVARAELDRRDAEYQNSLGAIGARQADIAKLEEKLHRFGLTDADIAKLTPKEDPQYHREASHTALKAPFSGVVIKYNAAEGEVVDSEDELFTLADLSTVWVQADIYQKDIGLVRQGQIVRIVTDAYPNQVFIGRITYVSDLFDPQTRTAKVRCEVDNPDGRMKLDMFVTVRIPAPAGRRTLVVPAAAIQQIDNQPVVFVQTGESEFQRRDVQVGTSADGWTEITGGLKEGEPIVAQGSFYVKSTLLRERIGGEE